MTDYSTGIDIRSKEDLGKFIKLAQKDIKKGYTREITTPIFKVNIDGNEEGIEYKVDVSFPSYFGMLTGNYEHDDKVFITEGIYILGEGYQDKIKRGDTTFPLKKIISLRKNKLLAVHETKTDDKPARIYGKTIDGKLIYNEYDDSPLNMTTDTFIWMDSSYPQELPFGYKRTIDEKFKEARKIVRTVKDEMVKQGKEIFSKASVSEGYL